MRSGPVPGTFGNTPGVQAPANATDLQWDAENRLISATVANIGTVTYQYDYLSRLIRRQFNQNTPNYYHYDGWNRVAEFLSDEAPTRTYTWGLDLSGTMQGAGGVGGLLATRHGSTSYFPFYDGNGNVTEYMNAAGGQSAHFEYDPYGTLTRRSGLIIFTYRFSTKPRDVTTGLYYYGYRYYDPLTGRWPSKDLIGERGGINLYGFLGNNGVNKRDVLGLRNQGECIWHLFMGHATTHERPAVERLAQMDFSQFRPGDRCAFVTCNHEWVDAHIPQSMRIPEAFEGLTYDGHYNQNDISRLRTMIATLNANNNPTPLRPPPSPESARLTIFSGAIMHSTLERVKKAAKDSCKKSCCESITIKVTCSDIMRRRSLWELRGLNGRPSSQDFPIGAGESDPDYLRRLENEFNRIGLGICDTEHVIKCK